MVAVRRSRRSVVGFDELKAMLKCGYGKDEIGSDCDEEWGRLGWKTRLLNHFARNP